MHQGLLRAGSYDQMLIAVKAHSISSTTALLVGAASLTIPAPVFASDPTPIGGAILLAGSAIALIAAALAALHRFLAIGLLVVCTIPLARGIMLAFVYIKSAVWLAAVGFLAMAALYCFATVWRLNKDYWSKQ